MDLMSSTRYWGPDQSEVTGFVGPCDATVMLKEVRGESKMDEERQAEIKEAREEGGDRLEEGAIAMAFDSEKKVSQTQSSSTREPCLEVVKDLENMPLVV